MSQPAALLLALLLSTATLHAQEGNAPHDIPFTNDYITDAATLKSALAAINKADRFAMKGGVDNQQALALYGQAHAVNPDNAELNCKIGICLLNGPHPQKALPWLERAAQLNPRMPRVHYLLGFALQQAARWDEAIAEYELHAGSIRFNPDPEPIYNGVAKRIAECRNGKVLMSSPVSAEVTNLGPGINTEHGEYGPLFDEKGNMYFTSKRPNTTGGRINKVNNDWFEDIYHSTWQGDRWAEPQPLSGEVNTNRNDATVALLNGGKRMLLYRDERNGGDLYETRLSDGRWMRPEGLPLTVNTSEQESSAWITDDGRWLYFVSSRNGGFGGSDIYRSEWDRDRATWGEPENLGPDINTRFDEEGVFAPGDGSTIYFASQGHNSMGGYDLFKSSHVDGRWTKPENLGWPINSPGDDQFLVLSADGQYGYFSSVRSGGHGSDDIYRVDFNPEQPSAHTALASAGAAVPSELDEATVRLIGWVKSLKAMEPLEATVAVMGLKDPDFNLNLKTDPATGRYMAELPAGRKYAVHVRAEGFVLHSEQLAGDPGPVELDMRLATQEEGAVEVMRNIFFKPDSHALSATSTGELEALLDYLQDNPELRIEVAGHTDIDTGAIPNMELSRLRAQVVVDWLIEHGVQADRLKAIGYGDQRPLAPNDSPANKAKNRRTEIRLW